MAQINMTEPSQRWIDENGFLRIDQNPVSNAGVYPYYWNEANLPQRTDPYRVLRSPAVLAAGADAFNGASIKIEHQFVGNKEGTTPLDASPDDGVVINPFFDGEGLYLDLIVKTQRGINFVNETTAKRALEGKKPAVSLGYAARYELQNGEYNGQTYDAVMMEIIFGNHLALLSGDGRINDMAYIKDGAAENLPHFDFTILNNNHKGDDMADDLPEVPEVPEVQAPIDDDSKYVLRTDFDELKGLVNQILKKIATAEGKQAATPAPEVEVKDADPMDENAPPVENELLPTDPEKNKVARVEDGAAIGDWLTAQQAVIQTLGVCTPAECPTAKSLYQAACKKLGVIAGSDPRAQFMAYLAGRGNSQPITAYSSQAAKVADGKAKGGIPLTRAEMSAEDWSN